MLKQFDYWKILDRNELVNLFEKSLEHRASAPYDFLRFAHNTLGIDVYNEYFLRIKMNEKGKNYLRDCLHPERHNVLSFNKYIDFNTISLITLIRRHLKDLGVMLKPIEFKTFKHPEAKEGTYYVKVENDNMKSNYNKLITLEIEEKETKK